jgi:protein SCO1/2
MTVSTSRRAALAAAGVCFLLGLTGCDRAPRQLFNGIDVSGADFGKDLRLPDIDGRERALADFKGKAMMVFFGFTQCPDVCPTALARAVEVKRLLGEDGAKLQVVFVTVDPERDTPAVLKAYLGAFDPGFIALRGNAERLAATARDFKIFYQKVPTGSSYTMDHSAISYVFDPQGRLRLALSHNQSAQACADDIREILHPA